MNKDQLKAMIKQYKDEQSNNFINSLPISKDIFHKLFDYLDKRLLKEDCNNNLKMTEEFLKQYNVPIEEVEDWLIKNGGGCDCEVLANVEDCLTDIIYSKFQFSNFQILK
jgi:hypothetical protein